MGIGESIDLTSEAAEEIVPEPAEVPWAPSTCTLIVLLRTGETEA
jgi:hypothetical protein